MTKCITKANHEQCLRNIFELDYFSVKLHWNCAVPFDRSVRIGMDIGGTRRVVPLDHFGWLVSVFTTSHLLWKTGGSWTCWRCTLTVWYSPQDLQIEQPKIVLSKLSNIGAMKARLSQSSSKFYSSRRRAARDVLLDLFCHEQLLSRLSVSTKADSRGKKKKSSRHKRRCWKGWRVVKNQECPGEVHLRFSIFPGLRNKERKNKWYRNACSVLSRVDCRLCRFFSEERECLDADVFSKWCHMVDVEEVHVLQARKKGSKLFVW